MNKYVTNLTLPNGTNVLIKDSECRTNLSNEINRATKKETLLQQNINDEASAREQADKTLQTKIKAIETVSNENNSEIATIHNDITNIENKNTEQDNELSTLRTMISSPYNFKGDVANISALPASGEVNDTYYVQDVKYKVTWTGSAWVQSSLNEADYQTELSELKGDLDELINKEKYSILSQNANWFHYPIKANTKYEFIFSENNLPIEVMSTNSNGSYVTVEHLKQTVEKSKFVVTPTKDAEYLLIWNNTGKLGITFTVENLGKIVPILESELSEKIKSLGLVSSIDVDNMKSGIKGFTATNVPSGLPKLNYAGSNFIITLKSDDSAVSSYDSQFLFIDKEIKAVRAGWNNSWLNWSLIHKKDYVVDVNGSGDYTNFTECIKFINDNQIKNANVFVKDGIYDIVAEAKLIYGDDYFETITNNYISGIKLYNNITIECEQNALLKFVYTGSNVNVLEGYSVFNAKADSDGYTLKNVNIYVKNGRYCVHDEHDGYSTYTNIYEGCRMEIDNSENPVWQATQCIGGGLGLHGKIKVNNCYFKTFKNGVNDYCVSYHNGVSANAKSNVVISNNYCEQGTIKASWYGQSTEKTDFLIYGNSLPNPIVVKRENSEYDVNNISVKEWNNEIRTN